MNQKQNNFNVNNFNTQDNNGMPNNQPLNSNQVVGYDPQTGQSICGNQPQIPINTSIQQSSDNKKTKNQKKSKLPYISLILFIIFICCNIVNILQVNKDITATGDSSLGIAIAFGFVFSFPILIGSCIFGYIALKKHFSKKITLNRLWLCISWITTLSPIFSILSLTIIPIILQIIN